MYNNDILLQKSVDFLKSGAKVVIFAHLAKFIAQNQPDCAHFGCFVQ